MTIRKAAALGFVSCFLPCVFPGFLPASAQVLQPLRFQRTPQQRAEGRRQLSLAILSRVPAAVPPRWDDPGARVIRVAEEYLGVRYVYGGTSHTGIDSSGLVQAAFRACGYRLPRTAREQVKVGVTMPEDQLRPGDRLYFSASGVYVDHTAIYIGGGQMIEANGYYRSVIIRPLSKEWRIFVGARRGFVK